MGDVDGAGNPFNLALLLLESQQLEATRGSALLPVYAPHF